MPIFRKGKGNWVKHCEQCGKPFIKTAKVQKKCEKCKKRSGGDRYKNTSNSRFKAQ
jgi:hypothetical protein